MSVSLIQAVPWISKLVLSFRAIFPWTQGPFPHPGTFGTSPFSGYSKHGCVPVSLCGRGYPCLVVEARAWNGWAIEVQVSVSLWQKMPRHSPRRSCTNAAIGRVRERAPGEPRPPQHLLTVASFFLFAFLANVRRCLAGVSSCREVITFSLFPRARWPALHSLWGGVCERCFQTFKIWYFVFFQSWLIDRCSLNILGRGPWSNTWLVNIADYSVVFHSLKGVIWWTGIGNVIEVPYS